MSLGRGTALGLLEDGRVVDDRVHRTDRVDLIGDAPRLASTRKIPDDDGGRALRQIVQPLGSGGVSRVKHDVMSSIKQR
jgi:hypothetical protein